MRFIATFCRIKRNMHKTARQKYVIDILSEQGQASITELAEKLQVSADTIRRDLTDLEKQGLAQKNHGGAIALNLPAMDRQGRNTLLPETKQRLGKRVAESVPAGSTLFLDAGSTVMAVARFLGAIDGDHPRWISRSILATGKISG
jgi:DeoR family glycerol-3-phosphate regulon repressor